MIVLSTHSNLIGLWLRKDHQKLYKNIAKEYQSILKEVNVIHTNHVSNSLKLHQKEAQTFNDITIIIQFISFFNTRIVSPINYVLQKQELFLLYYKLKIFDIS